MTSLPPKTNHLVGYANRESLLLAEAPERYRDLWAACDNALSEVASLQQEIGGLLKSEPARRALGLWGEMRLLQISSVLQLFARNLNEGLIILRTSTELAMVLRAIGTNSALFEDWAKNGHKGTPELSKASRLDTKDPTESRVLECHRFCSTWGVHRQVTSAAFMESTELGQLPGDRGVTTSVVHWLMSFGPMHSLALRALTRRVPIFSRSAPTYLQPGDPSWEAQGT